MYHYNFETYPDFGIIPYHSLPLLRLDLEPRYNAALVNYLEGEWQVALALFNDALAFLHYRHNAPEDTSIRDGPTDAIMRFIYSHNMKCPQNWPGYRTIDTQAHSKLTL